MPHLWVERQGKRISTLDLFDGRFIVFTGKRGTKWCEVAAKTAANLGVALPTYRIGADGDLIDPENGWKTKIGMPDEGVILVRPDIIVAWRSSTIPANPEERFEEVFTHMLAINKQLV